MITDEVSESDLDETFPIDIVSMAMEQEGITQTLMMDIQVRVFLLNSIY